MSWKNRKAKKGFTLIELMIVVAIIGILAAVAIPKFADLVTKSKEASVKGNLGAVRSAVSIYYSETEGIYPGNLHQGLCLNNKYMPPTAGQQALGTVIIPRHATSGVDPNPGHDYGVVLYDDVYTDTDQSNGYSFTDAEAFLYMQQQGDVAVDCVHKCTKQQAWTSY